VTYTVQLAPAAVRYLERLDRRTQSRISSRLAQLAVDPFHADYSKQLTNFRRLRVSRVGGWRIIYAVERDRLFVLVEEIGPRGQVYRRL
jgi:mRNA interferase RelE/StbE